MEEKIPCIVLAYYNLDVIAKTVDFLIEDKRLEIYVIENSSVNTKSKIQPFLLKKLAKREINGYYHFHENISGNIYELFFDSNDFLKISKNRNYIILTDGDLVVEPNQWKLDWLEEQKYIINKYDDIDCCAINISDCNLPTNGLFNTSDWIASKNGQHFDDYIKAGTGIHLILFKMGIFKGFLKWRKSNQQRFIDYNLTYYIHSQDKQWVITKHNKAIHLTWDIYNDASHPYTQDKLKNGYEGRWLHFKYCYYTAYYNDGTKKTFRPLKAIRYYIKKHIPFLSQTTRVVKEILK